MVLDPTGQYISNKPSMDGSEVGRVSNPLAAANLKVIQVRDGMIFCLRKSSQLLPVPVST
jgi:hypothetical protein